MAALDVLLHTSLWEGLPRVLPEAIASGVPIVATSVDGTSDILKEGQTGIVRPPGDVEGLAAGVKRLLLDRPFARRLAERARSVLAEFDIDDMVRAQERLYLSLLGTGRGQDGGRGRERGINNDGGSAAAGGRPLAAGGLSSATC